MSPTIERVETIALQSSLPEPFGYAQAWVDERTGLLVRIEATDGTVGWGECWGPIAGTRETIDDFLGPHVEGEDPLAVERLLDELYDLSRAAYQSIVPLPAISGIDIALWDLAGKLRGEPISALLGGRQRDAIRPYVTGHYFKKTDDMEEQYQHIIAEAKENADRFGAIKAKIGLGLLGYGPKEDIELVRRIRDTVGEETTLLVDANYAYDIGTARYVGQALADLDVFWFEEPVPPENIQGYGDLRDSLDVRIAGGECHAPYEFDRLFDCRGLDIAQPDLCNVGGITAARRVAAGANTHNVQVVPHVWGTPVAIAASLQFIATLDGQPWLEFDQSSNPLRDDLAVKQFEVTDDDTIRIPDSPGLGIELDEKIIAEYRIE